MPRRRDAATSPNLVPLHGVRGLACVWIVAGHFLLYFTPVADPYYKVWPHAQPPPPTTLAPAPPSFVHGGRYPVFGLENHSTVSLFFLISGFTFACGYNRPDSEPLSSAAARGEFYRKRVARLLPLYACGLLLGLPPFVAFSAPNLLSRGSSLEFALSFVTAPLGLQSIVMFGSTEWNGVLWSVSAFCLCYTCFPRVLRTLRVLRPATLGVLTHVNLPGLCADIGVAIIGATRLRYVWLLHFCFAFRLLQFTLGVASALLFQHQLRLHPDGAVPTHRLEALSALLLANQAACILLTALAPPAQASDWWSLYSFLAEWLLPGVLAAWIRALVHPRAGASASARLLSSHPLVQLGQLSYAVYTLHFPILQWAALAVKGWGGAQMLDPGWQSSSIRKESSRHDGWFVFPPWALLPLMALIFLIAAAFHIVLERPARAELTRPGRGARDSMAVAMESSPPPLQQLAQTAQPRLVRTKAPFGSGILLSELAVVRRSKGMEGADGGGTWPVQHGPGPGMLVPQMRHSFHSSVRRIRSGFEAASPLDTI